MPLLIMMVLAQFLSTAIAHGQENSDSFDKPYPSLADIHWISPHQEALQPLVDWLLAVQKNETGTDNFPGHLIFVGMSGGDYQNIAATIAAEGNAAFLADSAQVHQWLFGEAGLPVTENGKPWVLYADQIDQWIPKQGKDRNAFYRRLTELSQQGVALIGTILWPNAIPAQIEKYDIKLIKLEHPDLEDRKIICEKELLNYQVSQEVTPDTLALYLPGYHVLDIRELCREAAAKAASKQRTFIQLTDFEAVLDDRRSRNRQEYAKLFTNADRIPTLLASQVVIAHYHFRTPFVEYVTVESTGPGNWGHISHEDLNDSGRSTEGLIAFFLAGEAGSQLFFGESTYAARQSTTSAEIYAGRLMRTKHPDYRNFTLQERERIIQDILSEEQQRVSSFLREKKEEVEKIATALQTRKTLNRSEIENLLGN